MKVILTVTSAVYRSEDSTYDTWEEAFAGNRRLVDATTNLDDGIERHYTFEEVTRPIENYS